MNTIVNSTEMKTLDINQIKQYLPHRYPLLLVDRVLNWESGKSITAIKNVTVNESSSTVTSRTNRSCQVY